MDSRATVTTYIPLILMALIACSILFWSIRLGIGPMPTSKRVKRTISKILPKNVQGDIMELGCGWGTLLTILKRQYPRNQILAFERSPIPALWASIITSTKVINKDFFQADLGNPGLIVCYLFPGAMKRLEEEIVPKLPKSCWILTHTFHLPGWKPVKILHAHDLYNTPVYLYQVPMQK